MDLDMLQQFSIPIEIKDINLPEPEELNYWGNRKNRTFYIDYEIDDSYALLELGKTIIQMNMDEINIEEKDLKPIYIYIFSYGGDLDETFAFCDLLISSRIPIVTICFGVAMSAGFLIFLAGHKRYAFKHSQILIHSGSAGFQGTAEQIDSAQKAYKKQIEQMKSYILERTDIDEKLFNKNKKTDWYVDGDNLVTYGITDKFINSITDILE